MQRLWVQSPAMHKSGMSTAIPEFGKLRQEDQKFRDILGYIIGNQPGLYGKTPISKEKCVYFVA